MLGGIGEGERGGGGDGGREGGGGEEGGGGGGRGRGRRGGGGEVEGGGGGGVVTHDVHRVVRRREGEGLVSGWASFRILFRPLYHGDFLFCILIQL